MSSEQRFARWVKVALADAATRPFT